MAGLLTSIDDYFSAAFLSAVIRASRPLNPLLDWLAACIE